MRAWLIAIAAVLSLGAFDFPAQAQGYRQRAVTVQGVGCYWHRQRHYCNRYCYREVDGHIFCQPRLRDSGSQAPPPVAFDANGPRYRRR